MQEKPIHVLLAEDDEAHVELILHALDRDEQEFRVESVQCLDEARQSIQKKRPDILIVDYLLTDGKGLDLLPGPNTNPDYPIILMTSHGNEHVAVESIKAGALDYVVKSADLLADMPHVIQRALREWELVMRRRELEEQLRQSQKLEAIGTLAGGVAHDFNNILSAIIGYGELAREDAEGNPELISSVDAILEAGQRAKELVRQILAFSRQADSEKKPIHLQKILDAALKMLRASLPATIEIRQDVDMRCQPVMGNETGMQQIIMNLCTNAFHAMQTTGGVLDIKLSSLSPEKLPEKHRDKLSDRPYAQLLIKDNGPGIPDNIKDLVFDPYFTTKSHSEGTGLGLSMVHSIVQGHAGQIILESTEGEGAAFYVYLPLCQPADSPHAKSRETAQNLVGTENILFVDDEKAITQLAKLSLQRFGYHVYDCTNPLEALKLFQEQPDLYDVIITDLTMPNLTGLELAEKSRKIRSDIPIILCSGYSEDESFSQTNKFPDWEYVSKPVGVQDLVHRIRKLLSKS
ncbi:MAG: response regulator [Candidatus Sumerlaeota bacterium]